MGLESPTPLRNRTARGQRIALLAMLCVSIPATDANAAPRYPALECRGGGAMRAEYLDRRGSAAPVLTVRFVRAATGGDLAAGTCRLRQGGLRGSDPTVLVYRAAGERITQLTIAPTTAVTGVVGPTLTRLIERIRSGGRFTVRVTNSGRGWWEVRRVEP